MPEDRAHRVHLRVAGARVAARGVDLLHDHARRGEREPCAAVLLRDQRREPAVLGQRAGRTPRDSGRARARASTRPGSRRRARARPCGSRPSSGAGAKFIAERFEQAPRDEQLLDLVRALADQEQRRVAVVPLGPELRRVPVAAVDPHAVERVLLGGLGREVLRHPCLEVGALAGRLLPRRLDRQEPRRLRARRHLREHQLDRLVLADRLAERLALARVGERVVERRLRDADPARRDVDAADLDPAHEVLEALADAVLAAEDARRRRAEPVEDELGRLDALVAELGEARHRDLEAGRVRLGLLLDDEARHPGVRGLGGGVGLREEHHDPGSPAVRDPELLSRDDVVVALAHGDRPDRLDVRARVRLGHRERGAKLHRGEPREEPLALLLRAVQPDHRRRDERAVEDPRERHPAARELHHDQRVRVEPEPEPAVLLGDRRPEEPHLAHRLDHRLRVLVGVLELGGDGDDVAVDELAYGGDDLRLLGGELMANRREPSRGESS